LSKFSRLIPQNIAAENARRIALYDANGNRAGQIPLDSLTPPNALTKQYTFAAFSDVHYQYSTAANDLQNALTYVNTETDASFICICGDLTVNGTVAELTQYKNAIDTYSPNVPVNAVFGNHDTYNGLYTNTEAYTGKPFNYTFNAGNDVYIMMGIISGNSGSIGTLITKQSFQWLYEQLEANRNKRCFLFLHIPSAKGCGDAYGVYPYTKLSGAEATVFESLLKHYTNTIFFHGHTHMKFDLQNGSNKANYDNVFGCHSVHIPSLSVPRDVLGDTYTTLYEGSEGYLIDVYATGIHLKGRDFIKNEYMPIASYWLDTTLKEIPAKTYIDSTGTIKV